MRKKNSLFFAAAMFFYNLLLPLCFIFFLPGVIFKLWKRPGWKKTYHERFGIIGKRKAEFKAAAGAVWIHSVSVGETVLALSLIQKWHKEFPEKRFIISTGTTTGQQLARDKASDFITVIYCPIDFLPAVVRFFNYLKPSMLCIFETELWPNLISVASRRNIPLALVNARLSDHSVKGYRKIRSFMHPLLNKFDHIFAQSAGDASRFREIAPEAAVETTGNLKFDQAIPDNLPQINLAKYFPDCESPAIVLAASTHPGEEALIISLWNHLRHKHSTARLVIVPRHAERGGEIEEIAGKAGFSVIRRSLCKDPEQVPAVADTCGRIVIADTTGEMLALMRDSAIVIMGKAFAGQDEGHNLLEPALLGKPTITGKVLKNFRFVLQVLTEADGVVTASDDELAGVISELLEDAEKAAGYGKRASAAMSANRGAASRIISVLS